MQPLLYSYFRSSCSWRVRLSLILKGIDFETKSVQLLKDEQNIESYTQMNPNGKVPTLIINDITLIESMAILEYLEETYPEVALLPPTSDPIQRAIVRSICQTIVSNIQPIQNLAVLKYVGPEKKLEWGKHWITSGFIALEKLLEKHAGKYCIGDNISLADLCLVPQVYNARRFGVDFTVFPIIERIDATCATLEAFRRAHPASQPDCPEELRGDGKHPNA